MSTASALEDETILETGHQSQLFTNTLKNGYNTTYILGSAYYTLLASLCSMCTLYLKRFCESVRFERIGLPEVFEINTYPTIGSFLFPHLNCGNYQFMSKAIRTTLFGNQCVFLPRISLLSQSLLCIPWYFFRAIFPSSPLLENPKLTCYTVKQRMMNWV